MKNESLVIAGYYGFGNAGDELILLSLIETFRRNNPQIDITVLSANPLMSERIFGVRSINRWHPWSWARHFANADRFVLGGGGLLQETTGPWNYIYYLSLLIIAKVFGCVPEVVAIGVDPIQNGLNRVLTRLVFNYFCTKISVRDDASKKALQDCGVRTQIAVVRDAVFDLGEQGVPVAPADGEAIAFALSPWPGHPEWAQSMAEYLDQVKALCHAPIELLVFFPSQDESLARMIAKLSPAVRRIRVWESPQDVLGWMQDYQLIVGTRFHALVLAAMNQKPFIGWGSQEKVRILCQNQNMPYWGFAENWSLDDQLKQIQIMVSKTRKISVNVPAAPVL